MPLCIASWIIFALKANIPGGTFPGIYHHIVEVAVDEGEGACKAMRAKGAGGEEFGGAGYSLTAPRE